MDDLNINDLATWITTGKVLEKMTRPEVVQVVYVSRTHWDTFSVVPELGWWIRYSNKNGTYGVNGTQVKA